MLIILLSALMTILLMFMMLVTDTRGLGPVKGLLVSLLTWIGLMTVSSLSLILERLRSSTIRYQVGLPSLLSPFPPSSPPSLLPLPLPSFLASYPFTCAHHMMHTFNPSRSLLSSSSFLYTHTHTHTHVHYTCTIEQDWYT